MQRPFAQFLFSPKGRSGRLALLGAGLIWIPIGLVMGIVAGILSAITPILGMVILIPLYIANTISGFTVSIRRLHDIGLTGWLVMLPIVIVLAMIPMFMSISQDLTPVVNATQEMQALEASGDTEAAQIVQSNTEQQMQQDAADAFSNPLIWAGFGIIVIYSLALLFWPGKKEDNIYGPNVPLKQGS